MTTNALMELADRLLDSQEQCDADGRMVAVSRQALDELLSQLRTAAAEGETLSESDKDVAVAQAVELAEYVERQAKGTMVDAARKFLSLPYAQEIKARLTPTDSGAGRDGEFMGVRIIEDRRLRPREMMVCTGGQQHRYLIEYGMTPAIKVGRASHDTALAGAAGES